MPNPFTCARGRLGRGTAKSSLQRQPAGRVVSGGTPEPRSAPRDPACEQWGAAGARWLLFLPAGRSPTSRQQHRGSCGMRERSPAEPILTSFPTPTVGWNHSPPCAVSGCQQGEAKDPTYL